MNIVEIIEKKKRGLELNKEEIYYTIDGVLKGEIKDYQMSALLMAICLKGMTAQETTDLTLAMRYSGDVLDLSKIGCTVVDKHSTGGVGDKTTLILGPILAALGVPVAKMSGRGLGITGGTIDKLDSIPGFSSDISEEDFIRQVKEVGMVDAAQTKNLAPADKVLYALRDVTGTVDSIPLIASSIMSKKLASGADAIVLDVKCGSGAFMRDEESAKDLAQAMIDIAHLAGKQCTAVVSDMNQPLGYTVGNLLEVIEAVHFLAGKKQDSRLYELIKELSIEMFVQSDEYKVFQQKINSEINSDNKSIHELNSDSTDSSKNASGIIIGKLGREESDLSIDLRYSLNKLIDDVISDGRAYKKFKEFIAAQGGDVSFIESLEDEEKVKGIFEDEIVEPIFASCSGVIKRMDADLFGKASLALGAGRITKEADIDSLAGIWLDKVVGKEVKEGERIVTLYSASKEKIQEAKEILEGAIKIENWH